jgi:hypothetical protein
MSSYNAQRPQLLIGLAGYRRAGKSTLATTLARFGQNTTRASLAAPLREACAVLYGRPLAEFCRDENKGREIPGWGALTYRGAMVRVGTGMRRDAPDHWLRHLLARVAGCGVVVVDDVRHMNEALAMDIVLRVAVRPGEPAPADEPELEDVFGLAAGTVTESSPALAWTQTNAILLAAGAGCIEPARSMPATAPATRRMP